MSNAVRPSAAVLKKHLNLAMRWLGTLGLSYCVLMVLACKVPAPPDEQQPTTTLVFKYGKLFGDPGPFDRLIAQFEGQNPGIHVRRETLPAASDEQHQFYAINLQAGSSDFDVFSIDVIWVAEFAQAGWLRDLSPLLPPQARQGFFPGSIEAVTWNNTLYAVPWYLEAGLLYYRKDLLADHGLAPPKTWKALIRSAATITAKEPGLYGFVWQGRQYEGLVCNALEFLWSHGGEVIQDGRVVLDSPENRMALQSMRDLIDQGVTPGFVTTTTEEPARHIFSRGKAVYLRNWPYAWRLFEQPGSPVRSKVGITVLPHFKGHGSAATLGGWQLAINRYSKHPQEAEQLVRFLTSPEAQRVLALAYGYNPPRRELYSDPELAATQPYLAELYRVFEQARPRPITPYYVMISQVLQAEFSAVISGIKPPEAALKAAQQQIEVILNRWTS